MSLKQFEPAYEAWKREPVSLGQRFGLPGVMIYVSPKPHHGVGMRTDGRQEERRITIQGFGVRVNREWILYW